MGFVRVLSKNDGGSERHHCVLIQVAPRPRVRVPPRGLAWFDLYLYTNVCGLRLKKVYTSNVFTCGEAIPVNGSFGREGKCCEFFLLMVRSLSWQLCTGTLSSSFSTQVFRATAHFFFVGVLVASRQSVFAFFNPSVRPFSRSPGGQFNSFVEISKDFSTDFSTGFS